MTNPSDRAPRHEGWTWLHNSPKWHYFRDGRSLCGKWMLFGEQDFQQGKNNSPSNCAACVKKLAKEAKDE